MMAVTDVNASMSSVCTLAPLRQEISALLPTLSYPQLCYLRDVLQYFTTLNAHGPAATEN